MDFLRMYLGEIAGVLLALVLLFAASVMVARYVPSRRGTVRLVRNLCIALIVGGFAASMLASLAVNQTPKGRVDRTGVDADQKAFEKRVSDQGK